jgi:hypothetical protein
MSDQKRRAQRRYFFLSNPSFPPVFARALPLGVSKMPSEPDDRRVAEIALRALNDVMAAISYLSKRNATVTFAPRSMTVHAQPHDPVTVANLEPAAALVAVVLRLRRMDNFQ